TNSFPPLSGPWFIAAILMKPAGRAAFEISSSSSSPAKVSPNESVAVDTGSEALTVAVLCPSTYRVTADPAAVTAMWCQELGARGPGTIDVHERNAVIRSDGETFPAKQNCVRLICGRFNPRRPSHRRAVGPRQRFRVRYRNRVRSVESNAGPDQRSENGNARILSVIVVSRGIMRWRIVFSKMVNKYCVDVVGSLWIVDPRRFAACITVVQPECCLRTRLEIGNLYPHERFVEKRVVLFDVIGEQSFVVAGDKSDIAA